jgi:nucleoside-diphosphate-sugar epimerase
MAQDVYHIRKKKTVVIIGNGMVAGAFRNFSGWDDDILFASGVSNSAEKDSRAFQKEVELVRESLALVSAGQSFVYFSTTSIFDPAKSGSSYIIHKLFIEDMIKSSGVNYLIVRLPNLVGFSSNPNTLTNFFCDMIRQGAIIRLNRNATRHLIDVEDLYIILNDINARFGKKKVTVNVETDRPLSATKILSGLEDALKCKALIEEVEETALKDSDAFDKLRDAVSFIWKTSETYHSDLLRKYYSA